MTDRSEEESKARALSKIFRRKERGIKKRRGTGLSGMRSTAALDSPNIGGAVPEDEHSIRETGASMSDAADPPTHPTSPQDNEQP